MRSIRIAALLALPLAAATLAAAPAHADVKSGVEAWQRGDYKAAVAEWRPLAVAGDADAQFNLGQAYKLGRGVPSDLGQAEAWYRRAAKQGHLQAEDNLGLVLFTAGRRQEAMPYIEHSAARGEPRAQYVLGTAHFNGDLAEEDWPLAYALTKRASDGGLQLASARLAQLDQLIPLEQRQRGLAMLPAMEKNETRERLAAVSAGAPAAPATPKPSPIQTASLPASIPAATYAPPPVIEPTQAPAPVPVAPSPAAPPKALPSPAAQQAAAAAAEATAAADTAVAAATEPVAAAPSQPVTPGTSYAPPPESGPLPPKAAPVPVAPPPARPAPAPAAAAPAAQASAAPAPATPAAAASPWRAQLGAFAVEGNARKLWKSLEGKYPTLAARQPYLVKSAKLTRLQAGGFASKAEAQKFCATMKQGGQSCLVIDR